jgi:hypothetical protein
MYDTTNIYEEHSDDTIIIKTNPTTKKYGAVGIKVAIFYSGMVFSLDIFLLKRPLFRQ